MPAFCGPSFAKAGAGQQLSLWVGNPLLPVATEKTGRPAGGPTERRRTSPASATCDPSRAPDHKYQASAHY